jgi:hypothetical protein
MTKRVVVWGCVCLAICGLFAGASARAAEPENALELKIGVMLGRPGPQVRFRAVNPGKKEVVVSPVLGTNHNRIGYNRPDGKSVMLQVLKLWPVELFVHIQPGKSHDWELDLGKYLENRKETAPGWYGFFWELQGVKSNTLWFYRQDKPDEVGEAPAVTTEKAALARKVEMQDILRELGFPSVSASFRRAGTGGLVALLSHPERHFRERNRTVIGYRDVSLWDRAITELCARLDEARPLLVEMLSSPDADTRANALAVLAADKPENLRPLLPRLQPLLSDPSAKVSAASVRIFQRAARAMATEKAAAKTALDRIRKPNTLHDSVLLGLTEAEALKVLELDKLRPVDDAPNKKFYSLKRRTLPSDDAFWERRWTLTFEKGKIVKHEVVDVSSGGILRVPREDL